jgi:molybdopterin-guanine dinucleotide biosynthesis protein A
MAAEPLSVVILSGGRSERMGRPKAWLLLDGRPLVRRVAERLLPLASELIICANDPLPYQALAEVVPVPLRVAPDLHPGAGPLAGLEAGLRTAAHDLALAVAVDMPFLNLRLLRHMLALAEDHDAVVPVVPGLATNREDYEPLHAFYRRSCLPAIAAHLAQGHRRAVSFFPDVRVRGVRPAEIARFDPHFLSFFNVNTPADWERAQRLLENDQSRQQTDTP